MGTSRADALHQFTHLTVTRVAAAGLLIAAAMVATSPPAQAAGGACWDDVPTDVDGGGPDVVVGLPSFDLPGKPDAGAIVVYSDVAARGESNPTSPRARSLVTADDVDGLASQAGARFGASVVVWRDGGEFDDPDHCADVLVGAPGTTVGGKVGAGQVYLLEGHSGGALSHARLVLNEANLAGTGGAQAGAGFGSALASDTLSCIAIGVPGRDIGSARDAGHVVRLDYRVSDEPPDVTVVAQGGTEAGEAVSGDHFGEVLEIMPTGDGPILVVGAPREDVGREVDAGAVGMIPLNGHLTLVTQNSAGAAGTAEAGDRYGASISGYFTFTDQPVGMVLVGVPGEDVAGKVDAGMVGLASFGLGLTPEDGVSPIRGRTHAFTQDSPGVPGGMEAGDQFGSAVLTGEFGADNGELNFVFGSPREDLGERDDAGSLSMLLVDHAGTTSPLRQPLAWTQDSVGVADRAEAGDRFGAAVSAVQLARAVDDEDLAWPVTLVTVPRENVAGVDDAGIAYLGVVPGVGSVQLVPPVLQAGAGVGMFPMRMG